MSGIVLTWLVAPGWAPVLEALGHSLWQGALIAVGVALVLRRLRDPEWRHRVAAGGLASLVACSLVTWSMVGLGTTAAENSRTAGDAAGAGVSGGSRTAAGMVPAAAAGSATPADPLRAESRPVAGGAPREQVADTAARNGSALGDGARAWLVGFWLAGVVAMLARGGWQLAGADRLRRSGRPVDDPKVLAVLEEARRALGWVREVRLAVTNAVTSPAVVGWVSPVILLPGTLFTALTLEQLRYVLLHELAHVRRGDYLASLAAVLVEALYFFNPAVWWLSAQVRREREACCDALAVRLSGGASAPAEYARTLVRVAESRLAPAERGAGNLGGAASGPAALALGFAGDREPSSLAERVRRLVDPAYRPSVRMTWRSMLVAMAIGLGALWLSAVGTRWTVAAVLTPQERIERIERRVAEHLGEAGPDQLRDGDWERLPKVQVEGVIRTADGSPLPAVRWATAHQFHRGGSASTTVAVRPDGTFEATAPASDFCVTVEVPGYAPAASRIVRVGGTNAVGTIDVILNRGFPVWVQLVDAADGRPVSGGKVEGQFWVPTLTASSWGPVWRTADAAGRVEMGLGADNLELRVTARAPGYVLREQVLARLQPGVTSRVELVRGEVLRGLVTSRVTGRPLAGASVRILGDDVPYTREFSWTDPMRLLGETDANGRFAVTGLAAGVRYELAVMAPGHGAERLVIPAERPAEVVTSLGPERIVRGVVEGAWTNLQQIDQDWCLSRSYSEGVNRVHRGFQEWVRLQITNGVARFVFTNRLAGWETLVGAGYREEREVKGPIDEWRVVLPAAKSSRGPFAERGPVEEREVIFRFQAGRDVVPRGDVQMVVPDVVLAGGGGSARSERVGITNGEVRRNIVIGGRTQIEPRWTVGFWFPPTDHFLVTNGVGPMVVDVAGLPAGVVLAEARNADGSPAGGLFYGVVEEKRAPGLSHYQGQVGPTGDSLSGGGPRKWASGPLPLGGTYRIYGWRGNEFCVSEPVRLTSERPDAGVVLQFPAARSLRGVVRKPGGEPVAGARVELSFTMEGHGGFELKPVVTDAQGRFELPTATPGIGRYKVEVRAAGWESRLVELDEAKALGVAGQEIRLVPGRSLGGRLVESGTGRPIPGMEVRAIAVGDRRMPMQRVVTDDQGGFLFSTLTAGEYQLYADGGQLTASPSRYQADGRTNLQLNVTLYEWYARRGR